MLEKLQKRIQELVPEIMELKFGCRVRVCFSNGGGEIATVVGASKGFVYSTWAELNENKETVRKDIESQIEILGRDITLEDVLVAIEKKNGNNIGIFVNQYGILYSMIDEVNTDTSKSPILKYEGLGWFLGIPLHLQSEETIEFLYKIMSNK